MMRWINVLVLLALLSCASASICGSKTCSSSKPNCCGQFGCCSQKGHSFYTQLTGQLTGQCQSDTISKYASCISNALSCLDSMTSPVPTTTPECQLAVTACFQNQCQTSSTVTACTLTARELLTSSTVTQRPCIPNSCISSKQMQTFAHSLYSSICSFSRSALPLFQCAISDLRISCPTVNVFCPTENTCQTSYSTGGSATPAPAPAKPSLCAAPGQKPVDCAVAGQASGNISCCTIANYTLGCCTPDTDVFLTDMFANLTPTCGRALIREQSACFTKVAACLGQIQSILQRNGGVPTTGDLTSLSKCNVLEECSTAAQKTASCTAPAEKVCTVQTKSQGNPLISSLLLPTSTQFCLPTECSSSGGLKQFSQFVYGAFCLPYCQVIGGFSGVISSFLPKNCPLSSVSTRCPSSSSSQTSGSYTSPSTAQCKLYNISFGPSSGSGGRSSSSASHVTVAPGSQSHTSPAIDANKHGHGGISTILLVVIIIAAVLFAALLAIGLVYCVKRHRASTRSVVTYSGLNDDEDVLVG